MTLMEIELMSHYFSHAMPYVKCCGSRFAPKKDGDIDFVQSLVKRGLLEGAGDSFSLTRLGEAYVDALQAMPIPTPSFKVKFEYNCDIKI